LQTPKLGTFGINTDLKRTQTCGISEHYFENHDENHDVALLIGFDDDFGHGLSDIESTGVQFVSRLFKYLELKPSAKSRPVALRVAMFCCKSRRIIVRFIEP
jgi:hypothetical protein